MFLFSRSHGNDDFLNLPNHGTRNSENGVLIKFFGLSSFFSFLSLIWPVKSQPSCSSLGDLLVA